MVCSNSIISEEFGFSQGAERFHTLPLELSPRSNLGYVLSQLSERGGHARLIRRFFTIVRRLERRLFWEARGDAVYLTAPQVTGAFEQWRSELPREDPFFAYLHYIEPHAPYSAPGEHAGRFASGAQVLVEAYPPMVGVFFPFSKGRALSDAEWQGMISAYDAEIAYLDALLERLVGDLLARGPGDRETLIAITADHGEEFYEHGGWGHGHSLHEEQIAIPLILVGRDVPVDREVTEITALIDLAPTLLELAGIAVPTEMEGRSLVGHLGEEGDAGRGVDPEAGVLSEIVYSETYWARSLIHEEWKLIVSRLAPRDSVQLFHLATDPEEGNDLSLDQPERVRKLTERMWELVDRSRRWASEPELRPLDPVARERLRALGYVE